VKIDAVSEGLDSGDNSGRQHGPGRNTHGVIVSMSTGGNNRLEISGQGPEGAAAKIPQEPAIVLEEDPLIANTAARRTFYDAGR